jgi:hypothetical protein
MEQEVIKLAMTQGPVGGALCSTAFLCAQK